MTVNIQREAVRIVCPHCRRTYVIKVDMKKIYRTKPRAVCSRCGGRFEVVQRMYEIEQPLASTARHDSIRTPKRRKRSKRPKKPAQEQVVVDVRRINERLRRPPSSPVDARAQVEPAPEAEPQREFTPPHPMQMPESPPFSQATQGFPSPLQASRQPSQHWPTSTMPPAPSPYPIWTALSPLPEPPELRPPAPEDLETPMPWLSPATSSLEALEIPLPETAELLEWLLTGASETTEVATSEQDSSTPPPPTGE